MCGATYNRWLWAAIRNARELPLPPAPPGRVFRLAALVVSGGRVVALGHNRLKTSPVVDALSRIYPEGRNSFRRWIHAEMDALRQSNGNARGATLYVARVTADGTPVNASPCGLCRAMMAEKGIRRAFYTIGDNETGCLTLS